MASARAQVVQRAERTVTGKRFAFLLVAVTTIHVPFFVFMVGEFEGEQVAFWRNNHNKAWFTEAAAAAKELNDLGIKVNIGAHGQREGLAAHWEMWSFVRGGFSPMEALATATINPASYLKMDADIGSLEKQKLADLVILDANPLEDIRNSDKISHIMANGRLYEARTLRQVHSGDSELKPFYWQGKPQSDIF